MTDLNATHGIEDIINNYNGTLMCRGFNGMGKGWDISLPGQPALDSHVTDPTLTLNDIARNEAIAYFMTGAYHSSDHPGPWTFEVILYDEETGEIIASSKIVIGIIPDALPI